MSNLPARGGRRQRRQPVQDNVIPCPHCHGRGEVRVSWYVVTVYQDCSEWSEPYGSREQAEAAMEPPEKWKGYRQNVVMREVQDG